MASGRSKYVFSTLHKQVDLKSALWQLKKDRALEWEEIVGTLERSPGEFEALIGSQDVLTSVPPTSLAEQLTPRTFMNQCGSLNLSFGWLLQVAVNNLPFSCNFVTLLRDLQVSFNTRPKRAVFLLAPNQCMGTCNAFVQSYIHPFLKKWDSYIVVGQSHIRNPCTTLIRMFIFSPSFVDKNSGFFRKKCATYGNSGKTGKSKLFRTI